MTVDDVAARAESHSFTTVLILTTSIFLFRTEHFSLYLYSADKPYKECSLLIFVNSVLSRIWTVRLRCHPRYRSAVDGQEDIICDAISPKRSTRQFSDLFSYLVLTLQFKVCTVSRALWHPNSFGASNSMQLPQVWSLQCRYTENGLFNELGHVLCLLVWNEYLHTHRL